MNIHNTSVTSSKPGCQTPGGIGCDIKHNSYDRYLNRLKGKAPLRRGKIPPNFGKPIIFNPAFPVYGGKTTKTNIINGCNCPIISQEKSQDIGIYKNPFWQPYPNVNYSFNPGSYVYAKQIGNNYYTRAIVLSNNNGIYIIKFDNGVIETTNINQLQIYFPCNCNGLIKNINFKSDYLLTDASPYAGVDCNIPLNILTGLINV
jgi:hypothetical protein